MVDVSDGAGCCLVVFVFEVDLVALVDGVLWGVLRGVLGCEVEDCGEGGEDADEDGGEGDDVLRCDGRVFHGCPLCWWRFVLLNVVLGVLSTLGGVLCPERTI